MAGRLPRWYAFVRAFLKYFYFRYVTGGMRVVGEEKVPMEGGLIVAPNHVSLYDPILIPAATRRKLGAMAKEELFHNKILAWLIRSLGAYPVKRGEGDTEAIRLTMSLLEGGKAIIVFPEGGRGDGITMLPINRGIAMLAKRTGVPVLPVGIAGAEIVQPLGRKGRRAVMTVAFGDPFRYDDVATAGSERENRDLFGKELERRIVELCRANGYAVKTSSSDSAPAASPAPETPAETRSPASDESPVPN